MSGHWRHRAPASVLEFDLCAQGDPDPTTQDRRWLWRLESFLAVYGTNDTLRGMGADLKQYLDETCEHHWHHDEVEGPERMEAFRQCSWCYDTEFFPPTLTEEGGA